MKNVKKIIIGLVLIFGLVSVLKYFYDANAKGVDEFETEHPFITSITTNTVATGKLNPEEELELKPQVSGIIDRILVEEGGVVQKGQIIAKIRVVPNEQSMISAKGQIASAKLAFNNAKVVFERNKALYNKGVISRQDFETSELSVNQAKQNLAQAQDNYQIIKRGTLLGGGVANTNITALISGTILEIPVRVGDQVIQSNDFNAGTTIATIADMSQMIFEGTVDEAEVAKLEEGKEIKVVLAAIQDQDFPAKITFVAPKGQEENGAVQFKIKADVDIDASTKIRAGYSANAEIQLAHRDSVLAIKEALLQFDRTTEKPFVEIEKGDGKFEIRDVTLGLSDGINVEIIDGVLEGDTIKVWNKVSDNEEARKRHNNDE